MPYRLSGNDDDDEDNEDHGANNLILAGNFSALAWLYQNRITCVCVCVHVFAPFFNAAEET